MKKAASAKVTVLGMGAAILIVGTLFLVTHSAAGIPRTGNPVGFTLAATGGEPASIPFTLAPPAGESAGLAGPGGLGVIEDPGWPYRTALGYNALYSDTQGEGNTAIGYNALYSHGYGSNNTAIGTNALEKNYGADGITAVGAMAMQFCFGGGDYSTAIGYASLGMNRDRGYNTAVGAFSGVACEWGQENTAMGYRALRSAGRLYQLSSDGNTAIGCFALENLSGQAPGFLEGPSRYNTALGYKAGSSVLIGELNIFIGANQEGMPDDTNTIRIGKGQNRTFIAGIAETALTSTDGPSVVGITSEGRLGTIASDSLPQGPQGPQGIQGPQGPAGEGLIPGSLLYLPSGFAPPAGYVLLGITELALIDPVAKKATRLKVNVYQKR